MGTSCTISFWAKRHRPYTGVAEMIAGNDARFVVYFNGITSVFLRAGGDTEELNFNDGDVATALQRTDWVFWTLVRTSTTAGTLYVDGVSEHADVTNGSMSGSTLISKIGVDHAGQYPFKGAIDDLTLYTKVLSAPEVLRNYNAGKRSHR